MRLTSAFGRPTSYLDELPESSSRSRVGSASLFEGIVREMCYVLWAAYVVWSAALTLTNVFFLGGVSRRFIQEVENRRRTVGQLGCGQSHEVWCWWWWWWPQPNSSFAPGHGGCGFRADHAGLLQRPSKL